MSYVITVKCVVTVAPWMYLGLMKRSRGLLLRIEKNVRAVSIVRMTVQQVQYMFHPIGIYQFFTPGGEFLAELR